MAYEVTAFLVDEYSFRESHRSGKVIAHVDLSGVDPASHFGRLRESMKPKDEEFELPFLLSPEIDSDLILDIVNAAGAPGYHDDLREMSDAVSVGCVRRDRYGDPLVGIPAHLVVEALERDIAEAQQKGERKRRMIMLRDMLLLFMKDWDRVDKHRLLVVCYSH